MGICASCYVTINSVEVNCNRANTLFLPKLGSQVKGAAKILIHCLNEKWVHKGLPCFENMVNLIEQFYHPSNGGQWTSILASFLNHMTNTFMKKLAKQYKLNYIKNYINEETQEQFIVLMIKLASRGQYAKNDEMRVKACDALSQLAYVLPQKILPLIFKRFFI